MLKKENYPAWKVAAAILSLEKSPLHYIPLAQKVQESGYSGLGKKGKTPERTLNKFLNEKPLFFSSVGQGLFILNEFAPIDSSIRNIATKIKRDPTHYSLNDLQIYELENDYSEGSKIKRLSSYYERNPILREQAIRIHGTKCMVLNCGFDFELVYGELGKNFIEVHHLIPISTFEKEKIVDPEKELVVVCSNCHRMLHRKKDALLSIKELDSLIRAN